jgi:peptidyl-prolyl cis-trans isomerase C
MRIVQKRWLHILVVIVMAFCVLQGCKGEPKIPEGAVAVVNGEVITQEELDADLFLVKKQYAELTQADEEKLAAIKREILESLIAHEVLYQESRKKGIEVEETAVDEQVEHIKKQFQEQGGFENMLKEMNITEEKLKVQFREGIAIQRLVDQEVIKRIELSDEETKDYYDKNPDLFKQPEKLQARHILIKAEPAGDKAAKAKALKEIKDIQRKLKGGADFAELAKKYSQCPSSAEGGDLGEFGRGQMIKPFEDAAFALKKGEMSDIIETDFGYHLILAGEKKPETISEYPEVKDRIAQYLKNMKTRAEGEKYIEGLKNEAKIERFLPEPKKQDSAK